MIRTNGRGGNPLPTLGGVADSVAMGMLDAAAQRVAAGATIAVRPTGTSMIPLIASRSLVTIAPVDPARVEVGDIVLAKVAGTVYLHLVSAVNHAAGRVQISNNRGRVNGWTGYGRVYGICTAVDGVARPRTATKLRSEAATD
ncbi:S24 family peptidase [Hamadaea sp. NPDC051192]|uniref:S24 family peptidase n=1 Tax=Hamadaea sp. NPDC051192 TaxID=3154940 RepID=UPI003419409A